VARRPLWLAGIALATVAYGLQGLALAFGPLALVAPIVAADLLFALPLAAWWARRPLRARDWGGSLLVAAGVAVFLWTSPPSSGRAADVPAGDWFLVFSAVALISVLATTAGRITSRAAVRARLLAAAAGVVFGLTAAVTASLARSLRQDGLASIVTHWQPWVLISLGLAGLALSTTAYQAGPLSASLPVMDTVEPVSGVVIGALVFDERLASSPGGLVLQLIAAAIAVTGIALLGPSLTHMRQPSATAAGDAQPAEPQSAEPQHAEPERAAPERAGPGRVGREQAVQRQEPPGSRQLGLRVPAQLARPTQPIRPVRQAEPAPPAQHRSQAEQAGCDLLRVAPETTNTGERADHLGHLPSR
jgi:drug/metabolite transporter (DMT)-like permease